MRTTYTVYTCDACGREVRADEPLTTIEFAFARILDSALSRLPRALRSGGVELCPECLDAVLDALDSCGLEAARDAPTASPANEPEPPEGEAG